VALLLNRYNEQAKIIENIFGVEARDYCRGREIIELIFARRGKEVFIIRRVLVEAVSNYSVLSCLMAKKGEEFEISEEVLIAAAKNMYRGYDIMKLFLKR